MKPSADHITRTYIILLFLNTLASSMIWGVNTLFLLDAGLSNAQAFLVNAFFTVGQVIFEVPTGVVADIKGRRLSYLLGTVTLSLSTLAYLAAWQMGAGLWFWALASILLGLGFTFFSGATEAWLVDALEHVGHKGKLDDVMARGQMASGAAMLIGSVGGGVLAQFTNLGVPYLARAAILLVTTVVAYFSMHDLGFTPEKSVHIGKDIKQLFTKSIDLGLRNPAVRWIMLTAPFGTGVSFYAFYAMQPYLLELVGDNTAYGIAGLAAAIVAGAQIVGGMLVPKIRQYFGKRTTILVIATLASAASLILAGWLPNFWLTIFLLSIWGLAFAAAMPVRQAYLNGLIPSKQRATLLSFDSLLGSSGGVVTQPGLGRAADIWGYGVSFMISGVIQLLAVPFLFLAKRESSEADNIT